MLIRDDLYGIVAAGIPCFEPNVWFGKACFRQVSYSIEVSPFGIPLGVQFWDPLLGPPFGTPFWGAPSTTPFGTPFLDPLFGPLIFQNRSVSGAPFGPCQIKMTPVHR
mgnify:CR=1 FL=1